MELYFRDKLYLAEAEDKDEIYNNINQFIQNHKDQINYENLKDTGIISLIQSDNTETNTNNTETNTNTEGTDNSADEVKSKASEIFNNKNN